MAKIDLSNYQEKIKSFCHHWNVAQLSLFGSALRDDFSSNSDIDLLASFMPGTRHSLFDLVKMESELEDIFMREVDLIEVEALYQSENYIRRNEILKNQSVIYAAG